MIGRLFAAAPRFIVEARPEDADDIAEIHQAAFRRGWSADDFAALLRQSAVEGLIMRRRSWRSGRQLIGFILMRRAADEAEILTLAVLPAWQRRGVGRDLAEEAIRRAYGDGTETVFLEVEEGNDAAVGLYQALGFKQVATRSGYYVEPGKSAGNALVMRRQLR